LLALAGGVGDLGGVEQRLGRDAAAVQAGAADLVLLDHDHRQAELRGPERAGVAAATGPEDHQIGGLRLCCLAFGHDGAPRADDGVVTILSPRPSHPPCTWQPGTAPAAELRLPIRTLL